MIAHHLWFSKASWLELSIESSLCGRFIKVTINLRWGCVTVVYRLDEHTLSANVFRSNDE